MSAIIAHNYAVQGRFLPKPIAGMLLSAILSDTLNLRSPTTTAWDERVVAMLVQYLKVADVNELAARQFRAKSHSLSLMTPYSLVNGDVKMFKFEGGPNGGEPSPDVYPTACVRLFCFVPHDSHPSASHASRSRVDEWCLPGMTREARRSSKDVK